MESVMPPIGEVRRFKNVSQCNCPVFRVIGHSSQVNLSLPSPHIEPLVRTEPTINPCIPKSSARSSWTLDEWNKGDKTSL